MIARCTVPFDVCTPAVPAEWYSVPTSAGLLTERVERALDTIVSDALVAGPLGAHPDVVDAVCTLYHRAARDIDRDREAAFRG